jgi:hypothetical protein
MTAMKKAAKFLGIHIDDILHGNTTLLMLILRCEIIVFYQASKLRTSYLVIAWGIAWGNASSTALHRSIILGIAYY